MRGKAGLLNAFHSERETSTAARFAASTEKARQALFVRKFIPATGRAVYAYAGRVEGFVMAYRPQFAYQTPPGCKDLPFVYTFDAGNTPVLANDINGLRIDNIQLSLDQDAPFYWRGLKVGPLRVIIGGVTSSYSSPNFSVFFRDPYQNDLADNHVGAVRGGFPMAPMSINSALLTGSPVVLEPEIYCPPGGVIAAFLNVPTLTSGGGQTYSTSFSFYGVKRYQECAQ